MNNLHAYIQADLKYNLTRSKSNQYRNLLYAKHNAQTHKKQGGGGVIIGNNNKHKFEVKVSKYGGDLQIFIGSASANACVVGVIYSFNKSEIIIQSFGYNKSCNVTNDLERGSGVKKMMKTYLSYIKSKYPKVRTALLTDEAFFPCTDKLTNNSININFYEYYLIKHEIPYYVMHHGFDFYENSVKIVYEDNVKTVQSSKFNYKDFIAYLNHIKYKHEIPETLTEIMDPDVQEYTIEGIRTIIKKLGEYQYCNMLNIFLEYIIDSNNIKRQKAITYYIKL